MHLQYPLAFFCFVRWFQKGFNIGKLGSRANGTDQERWEMEDGGKALVITECYVREYIMIYSFDADEVSSRTPEDINTMCKVVQKHGLEGLDFMINCILKYRAKVPSIGYCNVVRFVVNMSICIFPFPVSLLFTSHAYPLALVPAYKSSESCLVVFIIA